MRCESSRSVDVDFFSSWSYSTVCSVWQCPRSTAQEASAGKDSGGSLNAESVCRRVLVSDSKSFITLDKSKGKRHSHTHPTNQFPRLRIIQQVEILEAQWFPRLCVIRRRCGLQRRPVCARMLPLLIRHVVLRDSPSRTGHGAPTERPSGPVFDPGRNGGRVRSTLTTSYNLGRSGPRAARCPYITPCRLEHFRNGRRVGLRRCSSSSLIPRSFLTPFINLENSAFALPWRTDLYRVGRGRGGGTNTHSVSVGPHVRGIRCRGLVHNAILL